MYVPKTFPDPLTLNGGSLLVAWQLKGKRVLIVGGGDVASGRLQSVLVADALVTLISPRKGLHSLTKYLIDEFPDRITYHDRTFSSPEDLDDVQMVLTAIDDPDLSHAIHAMCRERKIPVNVADVPPLCDFYFGSQISQGPLQIMVSTNGHGPKMANLIRRRIEENLPNDAGEAIQKVGELRRLLRERAPGAEIGRKRMKWMVNICTSWDFADLASLNDEMTKRLLDDGWDKGCVPTVEDVGGKRKQPETRIPFSNLALPIAFSFLIGCCFARLVIKAYD
jgi:precorrin-2 dehydrogenase / sirohydrochlorin ferrochelatase